MRGVIKKIRKKVHKTWKEIHLTDERFFTIQQKKYRARMQFELWQLLYNNKNIKYNRRNGEKK